MLTIAFKELSEPDQEHLRRSLVSVFERHGVPISEDLIAKINSCYGDARNRPNCVPISPGRDPYMFVVEHNGYVAMDCVDRKASP